MAFKESIAKLYVHLHPSCLDDPMTALKQELNSKLLTWDEVSKGVVVSYDKITVLESKGRVRIFQDSPFMNVHVSVRLLLFCPKPGGKLVGEVNFISPNTIGLLVHGIFNASIAEENIPQDWEFNDDDDDAPFWQCGEEKVEVGSYVSFEVLDIRSTDDILSIQASILDEDKYGLVGKAEVAVAERHKLDPSLGASLQAPPQEAKVTAASSSQKRKAEDDAASEVGEPSGRAEEEESRSATKKKKGKKEHAADPQAEAASNVDTSNGKSDKTVKKEKKEKKDKSEKKEKKAKKAKKGTAA